MNTKSLIGGLLAGAAVGVAIGILLAPASGQETQAKIGKGARKLVRDTKDVAEDAFANLKNDVNHAIDGMVKAGNAVMSDGRNKT